MKWYGVSCPFLRAARTLSRTFSMLAIEWATATRTSLPATCSVASFTPSRPRIAVSSMEGRRSFVSAQWAVRSAASITPPVTPKIVPAPV